MTATRYRSDRIPELEGLRAVLAWTVVAAHVLICSGYFGPVIGNQNLLSDIAESAVDVFIILSGFVITRLVLVERESYKQFLWRRVRRIVPAYWVALIAAVATNSMLANNLRHFLPNPAAATLVGILEIGAERVWIDLPLHVLLLQGLAPANLLPGEPYTFLGVAWSLSLEWQFYLLAPVAAWFALRRSANALALVALGLACALLSSRIVHQFSNAFLPSKAALFIVGGYCFNVIRSGITRDSFVKVTIITSTVAAAYLISSHRVVEALLPALIWIATMACICRGVPAGLKGMLNSAPFQHLGRISYSTYLFHAPIVAVIQGLIWNYVPSPTSRFLLLVTAPLAVACTYAVSYVSWRLVEKPMQIPPRRQTALP